MTLIDRPPSGPDMRWRVPKSWNSYGVRFKRLTGQFIALDTSDQDMWLRRRLEVTAEACRRIIDAWKAETTASNEARRRIAAGTQAYLTEVGLTENEPYRKPLWADCERMTVKCQTYIKKQWNLDELRIKLKNQHPSAFPVRLYCGRVIDGTSRYALKHDGGTRWEIEPNLWVTAARPLCDILDVYCGEVALICDRWMARFTTNHWA